MFNETITELISSYGYLAIGGLIALENLFPPIPSELILTFAGYLTLTTAVTVPGAIVAATIGAVAGALLLYLVGTFFNREKLTAFAQSKVGKALGLSPEKIEKAENYFLTHGKTASFFGRFIPVVRSLISIPAGMSRYSLPKFLLFTSLGTALWNTVLIMAGRFAGNAYQEFLQGYEQIFMPVVLAILVIAGIIYLLKKRKASV